MADKPLEYLQALMEHYPDLCARINRLNGVENLLRDLSVDRLEGARVEVALAAACVDFQERMAEIGRLSIAEQITNEQAHEACGYALTMALNNAFGLGVWLAEQKLARWPTVVPRSENAK